MIPPLVRCPPGGDRSTAPPAAVAIDGAACCRVDRRLPLTAVVIGDYRRFPL
jgi:hypothetical protein